MAPAPPWEVMANHSTCHLLVYEPMMISDHAVFISKLPIERERNTLPLRFLQHIQSLAREESCKKPRLRGHMPKIEFDMTS